MAGNAGDQGGGEGVREKGFRGVKSGEDDGDGERDSGKGCRSGGVGVRNTYRGNGESVRSKSRFRPVGESWIGGDEGVLGADEADTWRSSNLGVVGGVSNCCGESMDEERDRVRRGVEGEGRFREVDG